MILRFVAPAILAFLACGTSAAAQPAARSAPAARAEVLVLGVYHMANPGNDLFNVQADDVLSPKRQAEIAELMAVLRKFQPTKIAVERNPGDSRLTADYSQYLGGKRELTRNEIEQIGYRLARELGHPVVHGIDADGEFPYPRLVKYAKAAGREAELDTVLADIGKMVERQNAFLATHTVLETMLYVNSESATAEAVGHYYRQAHFTERWDWAGPDLVADWFRRNVRIYGNVIVLANAPKERVLVIIGAGHLGWLQSMFAADPTIRLRKLSEFVK